MILKNELLVLLGALIGGTIGYFVFGLLYDQNLYGLVIPGGLLGLGAGCFKSKTIFTPVLCGLLALLLSLWTEWKFRPFLADSSLAYFVTHLGQLKLVTWIMSGLGMAAGFWIPFRRRPSVKGPAG